ncbi:MAG: hypothetical protein DRN24_07020 [Thermoplasmata archaeon]|nr:MAG: hypothetical protein DRN24_07020 [Thermoplasmata archaeon]
MLPWLSYPIYDLFCVLDDPFPFMFLSKVVYLPVGFELAVYFLVFIVTWLFAAICVWISRERGVYL